LPPRDGKQAGLPPGWPHHRPSSWQPSEPERIANASDDGDKP
jgi:hypothetical protein